MTLQLKPFPRALLATSLLAMLALSLSGCGPTSASKPSQTSAAPSQEASAPIKPGFGTGANTAQGHYDAAETAMKAVAPDAVFISVQTGAVGTNPPALWTYLFASKKTGKAYAVTVAGGVASKPLKLTSESLRADEWSKVPPITEWKVDSDVALRLATAAYNKQLEMAPPKKFAMGMTTFVADATAKNSPKPLTWVIAYQTEDGVVPGVAQIEVDARTGQVLPLPE